MYVITGAQSGKLSVFDVQREFELIKQISCKSAIRALSLVDGQTLIVGQNDGWFQLVHLGAAREHIQIISSV